MLAHTCYGNGVVYAGNHKGQRAIAETWAMTLGRTNQTGRR